MLIPHRGGSRYDGLCLFHPARGLCHLAGIGINEQFFEVVAKVSNVPGTDVGQPSLSEMSEPLREQTNHAVGFLNELRAFDPKKC